MVDHQEEKQEIRKVTQQFHEVFCELKIPSNILLSALLSVCERIIFVKLGEDKADEFLDCVAKITGARVEHVYGASD